MIHLRQICLVARQLAPVIDQLESVLGIERCYVDPGVATFGLENTLLPIGSQFLEVVAPTRDGTAAGRYLDRRGGDGGYMVITQADSEATQSACRERAASAAVRVAWEREHDGFHIMQLHPGDLRAGFFEIDHCARHEYTGFWEPAGGDGWQDKVHADRVRAITGVELQDPDPVSLAQLWSGIADLPVERDGDALWMRFESANVRFVEARDGRGPGLGGIDLDTVDAAAIRRAAQASGLPVADDHVSICGTRFYLDAARGPAH